VWPWQEAKSSGKTLTNLLKCVALTDAERTTFLCVHFLSESSDNPGGGGRCFRLGQFVGHDLAGGGGFVGEVGEVGSSSPPPRWVVFAAHCLARAPFTATR
jgi:hypothetical protein